MTSAAVYGTGSWGTAFASVLADAGTTVTMWGRRAEVVEQINAGVNEDYLPELRLLPRRTMKVRAGRPVALDDLYGREITAEVLHEATARIMAAITAELEVLRGEKAPVVRFDPRAHGVTPIGKPRPLEEAS